MNPKEIEETHAKPAINRTNRNLNSGRRLKEYQRQKSLPWE